METLRTRRRRCDREFRYESQAAADSRHHRQSEEVFTNAGRAIDWFQPHTWQSGRWFLEEATQVKNIWVPTANSPRMTRKPARPDNKICLHR